MAKAVRRTPVASYRGWKEGARSNCPRASSRRSTFSSAASQQQVGRDYRIDGRTLVFERPPVTGGPARFLAVAVDLLRRRRHLSEERDGRRRVHGRRAAPGRHARADRRRVAAAGPPTTLSRRGIPPRRRRPGNPRSRRRLQQSARRCQAPDEHRQRTESSRSERCFSALCELSSRCRPPVPGTAVARLGHGCGHALAGAVDLGRPGGDPHERPAAPARTVFRSRCPVTGCESGAPAGDAAAQGW